MNNGFQKTVDLKDKMKKKNHSAGSHSTGSGRAGQAEQSQPKVKARVIKEETPTKKKRVSRARGIDQVYSQAPSASSGQVTEEKKLNEFQQIERAPRASLGNASVYKFFTTVLGLVLVAVIVYFIYVAPGNNNGINNQGEQVTRWYAVELVNGETYYGQVTNTSADPVIIDKVYYNYDQLNSSASSGQTPENKNESGNLRLIKRGKETHGPEGEMSVVRAQVLFMEALKEDSMVLKAILDYEK